MVYKQFLINCVPVYILYLFVVFSLLYSILCFNTYSCVDQITRLACCWAIFLFINLVSVIILLITCIR